MSTSAPSPEYLRNFIENSRILEIAKSARARQENTPQAPIPLEIRALAAVSFQTLLLTVFPAITTDDSPIYPLIRSQFEQLCELLDPELFLHNRPTFHHIQDSFSRDLADLRKARDAAQ